jgi:hypothetical protein
MARPISLRKITDGDIMGDGNPLLKALDLTHEELDEAIGKITKALDGDELTDSGHINLMVIMEEMARLTGSDKDRRMLVFIASVGFCLSLILEANPGMRDLDVPAGPTIH